MPELNMDLGDVSDDDMGPRGYRAFDSGKYLFHIVESYVKTTRAGTGRYIKLVWECMEPGRKGKVFENVNIENPNETAVRIGRAQLKEIAIATGHPNPNFIRATEELHLKPCLLTLKKVRALSGGDVDGMTNEVTGHDRPDYGDPKRNQRSNEPPPPGDDAIPF